ncbi:hypothetical protein AMELA_G00078610 [Ameiurus melas]|uniref:Uncharacterized protein n=1 Tax=Ameiurus melas TaxID=219545 RepID=A0A7J6AZI6_AMEME|nr:hypothetical protein AMELA_G00078610 [Ameiurus melas]
MELNRDSVNESYSNKEFPNTQQHGHLRLRDQRRFKSLRLKRWSTAESRFFFTEVLKETTIRKEKKQLMNAELK